MNPYNARAAGPGGGQTRPWYRITNFVGPMAEIYLYDEIGMWGTTANDFVAELRQVQVPRIDLHLNSPGGDVFEGVAIYNALRSHPATVTMFVDGIAASAASFIAMAGDRIVMRPNSQLMIHMAHGICVGNADDMAQMKDLLDRQTDNIASIYAARAGGTTQTWRDRMAAETWYSAPEAVQAGLADEVRDFAPRPGMHMEDLWDLSVFAHAGRADAPDPLVDSDTTTPSPAEPEGAAPPAVEPEAEPPAPTETEETPPVAQPTDDWADLTAQLFTEDPQSSDVDDEFARLREALL